MPDFRMLNGYKKGTAIVRFDGTATLIVRAKKGLVKKEFKNIEALKRFKEGHKIETNVEYIQEASIRPENTREWNIVMPKGGVIRQFLERFQ